MSSVNYIYGDLNISGQLKISSGATAGYVLTSSDSSGNCIWSPVVSGGIAGLTGSGTTNYLSKFTGTNSISNSRISDDGQTVSINSKVQIGTGSVAVGTYSHAEGINTTSSSDGSHAEGHFNLAGIRKFDCYINNGLVRIINGVDYTPDFTSGVVLLSNGLTYSYSTSSCTYSTPVFSFQLDDTNFMSSTETDFFNYEAGQVSNIRAILYTPNSIFNNNDSYSFGGNRYVAGITMNLNLKLVVTNADNDFPDLLTITVPNGWKINSASPYIGLESWNYHGITFSVYDYYNNPNFWNYTDVTPKGEPFMGLSNNDKTATWGFNNDVYGGIWNNIRGVGVISPDGTYDIVLNVTIDEWVSGIQTLNFFLSTSSFDTDLTNGVLNLQPEGLWVVDSSNLANIKGTPIGNGSHAEGFQTTSIGDYSHTSGIGTIAMSEGQFSIGKWNTATNSNNLFTIGNGTSSSNRSDLAIFKDDSITFNKSLILKDGTHGSGKILVSDSNGLASWTQSISGITGSGTTNYISKFTGTNSISNSRISDDGQTVSINSKVQIGTGSVAVGTYSHAEGINTTSSSDGSHAEGHSNLAGIRKFDCYINNGLVRITNGVNYTPDFTNGVILMSDGLTYSYNVMSCTYSNPIFQFQMDNTGFMANGSYYSLATFETILPGPPFSEISLFPNNSIPINIGGQTTYIGGDRYKTGDINLNIQLNNSNNFFCDFLAISVPEGWIINSASPFLGDETWVSVDGIEYSVYGPTACPYWQQGLIFMGVTCSGRAAIWGHNGINGGIPNDTTYPIKLNVTIDESISGIQTLSYFASPDADGEAASLSQVTGTLDLQPEGLWVVDSSNLANIKGTPIGNGSHAEGFQTTSIGDYSHTGGIGTIAMSEGQFSIGKWNTATNSNNLFTIGNGTSSSNRSDLAIFKDDSITFNKSLILKDGTHGSGKILVSDSNGLASWTASVTYGSVNKYESLNVSITMGVTQSFTHSLNSTSIITQIWDNDSGEIIYGKFFNRQPNSVDLVLSNTYTSVDIIIMS